MYKKILKSMRHRIRRLNIRSGKIIGMLKPYEPIMLALILILLIIG